MPIPDEVFFGLNKEGENVTFGDIVAFPNVVAHFRTRHLKDNIYKKTNMMIKKFLMLSFIGLIYVSLSSYSHRLSIGSQQQQKDTIKLILPIRAVNSHKGFVGEVDTLYTSIDNVGFTIYPNGLLRLNKDGILKLSEDMGAIKAYFYKTGSSLILFCEMSDGDGGTSYIYKIDISTKQFVWKANINGFNLGLPIIRGHYAYVSVIGGIGKLDLNSGKFDYKFSDLYDNVKYSFNQFDTIIFKGNATYFLSKIHTSKVVDTVIVNEKDRTITIKK